MRRLLTFNELYNVFFVALVVGLFSLWDLLGGGVALALTGLLDMLMLLTVFRLRYALVIHRRVVGKILIQGLLVLATILLCLYTEGLVRYSLAIPVLFVSAIYTFDFLKKSTGMWQRIRDKFRK